MISIARLAFAPSGERNVATPLLIASRPVSEEPPLANARSSTSTVAPMTNPSPCPMFTPGRWVGSTCGRLPSSFRMMPTTIIDPATMENR